MSFESVLDLFMNRVFGPTVKVVVPSKAKMAWLRFAIATEPYDRAMDNYIRYTDDCIRIARLPFQKGAHTNVSMPTDPIGSFLSNPATWKVRCRKAINDCDNRQLELQLALHAYSLDHGRYPSALTMLVPAYIPSVPDDPFADAGPLRYRLTGKTYVLYSVGTDGIDDNGKPIVNKGGEAKDRYRVKTGDERGDFVAGVNY